MERTAHVPYFIIGLLAAYCERDMKDRACSKVGPGHNCCDICARDCDCNSSDCGNHWCLLTPKSSQEIDDLCMATSTEGNSHSRHVSDYHKQELIEKLLQFQKKLAKRLDAKKYVSCPNVLMEFNKFHINQVVNNCHMLFGLHDVHEHVEIWQNQYACIILQIIAEVFGNIEYNYSEELKTVPVLKIVPFLMNQLILYGRILEMIHHLTARLKVSI